jgi:hypothetical protein
MCDATGLEKEGWGVGTVNGRWQDICLVTPVILRLEIDEGNGENRTWELKLIRRQVREGEELTTFTPEPPLLASGMVNGRKK